MNKKLTVTLESFNTLPDDLRKTIVKTLEHAMKEDDAHGLSEALEAYESE